METTNLPAIIVILNILILFIDYSNIETFINLFIDYSNIEAFIHLINYSKIDIFIDHRDITQQS